MRPLAALLASLLAALLLGPLPAFAWGEQGHAAVGALAGASLTPAARAQVTALLANDRDAHGRPSGRTTLAEIAGWADEIREVAPPGTYEDWHVRDNPVCGAGMGPCRDGRCVDRLLADYIRILGDRSQPQRPRNEALKWVVHLVGDIHQPLHAGGNGDENGDFPVVVESLNDDTTFHWAWDNELAELALRSGPLSGSLAGATPPPTDAAALWMAESRAVAREHAYGPLPGFACGARPSGIVTLDRAYQEKSVPVIRAQMQKAGLRLAEVLNAILK
jgi:hypothetical protein